MKEIERLVDRMIGIGDDSDDALAREAWAEVEAMKAMVDSFSPFVAWAREMVEFWNADQPDSTKTAFMGGHVFTLGHCRAIVRAADAMKETK